MTHDGHAYHDEHVSYSRSAQTVEPPTTWNATTHPKHGNDAVEA
ncbi:hypothetical protein QP922_09655 [Corynebacterium sp. MSK218]|nr:hypothetical protein [Corynebacterium sp. MSK218]MDK8764083.1 hypothetical protein [Corynebacterium sp. MSK218]